MQVMSVLQSVILGALQGVTEFLPVSSSGHLVVFRDLLGIRGIPLFYDVLLHVATLLVIIYVFKTRIAQLIASFVLLVTGKIPEESSWEHRGNIRVIVMIIIATAVTAVVGLTASSAAEGIPVRAVYAMFLVTATLLITGRLGRGKRELIEVTPGISVLVGTAQGLGTLPGISRSGITITALLLGGMDRKAAGEFSFLISLPAVLGALILELIRSPGLGDSVSAAAAAAGFATAAVTGFLSLKLLLYLVREGRLYLFSFYLIPLGLYGLFFR